MPPSPLSRNFLLLWRNALGRAFGGKRGLVLVLLALFPIVIAWVQVENARHLGTGAFVGVMLMFVFQFIVPLVGLFVGVAAFGDEVEGRTLTYLFTRPQPRALVFLARYFGLTMAFAAVLLGAIMATAFVYGTRVEITAKEAAATAGIGVLGFFVYAAFFAALRVFVQRALFVGFLLTFIFEGFASKIPNSGVSRWFIWHHVALLETRLFGDRLAPGGDLREVLGGIAPDETVTGSLVTLGAVFVLSLAAGAWRVGTQETRLANAAT